MKVAVASAGKDDEGTELEASDGITFRQIGKISSAFHDPKELKFACKKGLLAATESKLVINGELSAGLEGLRDFSHVWVLYFLHRAHRTEMRTYPGPSSVSGLPEKGVFATRSQYRPNHIALRLVGVKGVCGNVVEVRGLDAIDGSPLLDVKPYVPHFDRPSDFRVPVWCSGWDA